MRVGRADFVSVAHGALLDASSRQSAVRSLAPHSSGVDTVVVETAFSTISPQARVKRPVSGGRTRYTVVGCTVDGYSIGFFIGFL